MLLGKTPPVEDSSKLPSAIPSSTNSPPGTEPASPKPRQSTPATANVAAQAAQSKELTELRHPSLFLNRELTWLNFNHRVLNEAADKRTPLLERLKFLAIVGSNLDEFQM